MQCITERENCPWLLDVVVRKEDWWEFVSIKS